jgi:hypothetical protein
MSVGIIACHRRAASSVFVLFGIIVVVAVLAIPPSHSNITSNSDSATLLSDSPAQDSALSEPWELLGTEDSENI